MSMGFAEAEYAHKKHKTRRELFLEKMDTLILWVKLEKKLARHYPKGENGHSPNTLISMNEHRRVSSIIIECILVSEIHVSLIFTLWLFNSMTETASNPCELLYSLT